MPRGNSEHFARAIICAAVFTGNASLTLKTLESFVKDVKSSAEDSDRVIEELKGAVIRFHLFAKNELSEPVGSLTKVESSPSIPVSLDKLELWGALCAEIKTSPLSLIVRLPNQSEIPAEWKSELSESFLYELATVFFLCDQPSG